MQTEQLPDLRTNGTKPASQVPTTQAEINGYTWTIPSDIDAAGIERVIKVSKALAARGFTAPRRMSFGGMGRPAKPVTQPLYNDAGDACCPTHQKRLYWMKPKDNWPGKWKCPCKSDGTPGEVINERGYCDHRFDLPAPAE